MPLFLALLAQIGPAVTPGAASPLPHERAVEAFGARPTPARAPAVKPCPEGGDATGLAEQWAAGAKGSEQASASECLGVALSRDGEWSAAAQAFGAARAAADTPQWRARLGAMAGEAALNAGEAEAALAALDGARSDAAGDKIMLGGIAAYRARALVALKREDEAAAALSEAREAAPASAQAWLLSATLSRRMGKLAEAQTQIERAFDLRPIDPEIGLEAGVIAVLSGRDAAARKSWQSVIAAAPESAFATTARGYLAQLGGIGQGVGR